MLTFLTLELPYELSFILLYHCKLLLLFLFYGIFVSSKEVL
jgi:hypothetical protein